MFPLDFPDITVEPDVVAASLDLQDSALSQASAASHHFISEIVFLGLLALASLGGVIMGGRVLTRPLKALAVAAG